MGNDICFLITIFDGVGLLRCALKINKEELGNDVCEYPMEPENMKIIHALLPEDIINLGHIVDVTTDLHDITVL